ncbi:MAG: phage holin family protein [Deltaproteobacteria bacterium]|nr:phage holin family protein [Deltaproteobacteria bacterium]
MRLLINWVILTAAILLAAYLIPGVRVRSLGSAFIAAAVLGIINVFIRPIAIFLSIPLIVVTLGLFTFIVNALLLWLAAAITPGFEVRSFWAALLGALVVSIVSYLTGSVL